MKTFEVMNTQNGNVLVRRTENNEKTYAYFTQTRSFIRFSDEEEWSWACETWDTSPRRVKPIRNGIDAYQFPVEEVEEIDHLLNYFFNTHFSSQFYCPEKDETLPSQFRLDRFEKVGENTFRLEDEWECGRKHDHKSLHIIPCGEVYAWLYVSEHWEDNYPDNDACAACVVFSTSNDPLEPSLLYRDFLQAFAAKSLI